MARPKKTGRHPALDLRVPFFQPMWRRVLTVALLGGWVAVELTHGNPWWALLAAGIGVYAAYVFFFDFRIETDDDTDAP